MRLESLFLNTLADWGWLAYLVIFFLLWVEGDMVVFASVYLAEDGYLSMAKLIPVLFLGTLTGDILWYRMGGTLAKRFGWVAHWSAKITNPLHRLLTHKPHWAVFVSKFTYGLNKATLIWAGAHKVDFKKVILTELFTLICWLSVLGNLAYASAASSLYLKSYLKYAEVGLLVGIFLLFLVTHVLAWISQKMFVNGNEDKDKA